VPVCESAVETFPASGFAPANSCLRWCPRFGSGTGLRQRGHRDSFQSGKERQQGVVEHLEIKDIAIRLILTILAGGLIGLDRGERGRAAGLRTMILVCLAASAAMIQVNLLFNMAGRPADAYVTLDLMRLPLGVLSGIGFIGGGAILRSGNRITGVTTAATLWFVTVMGLCLGGGQIGLGLTLLVLGLIVLRAFKWLERGIKRELHAMLSLTVRVGGLSEDQLRGLLAEERFQIISISYKTLRDGDRDDAHFHLRVKQSVRQPFTRTPDFIRQLSQHADVKRLSWKPDAG